MLRYLKAFVAAVTAFGVPFAGALTETSDKGATVTAGEWITALVAGVVAGVGVAVAKNKDDSPPPE